MGYIIVVSAPVILFILIVALAFYLLGRATGEGNHLLLHSILGLGCLHPKRSPPRSRRIILGSVLFSQFDMYFNEYTFVYKSTHEYKEERDPF